MKAVKNLFTFIGDSLTIAVKYFDERVVTGKFTRDIKLFVSQTHETSQKKVLLITTKIYHTKITHIFLTVLIQLWRNGMNIPSFALLFSLIRLSLLIVIRYYGYIFITFAITLVTVIILLHVFETDILYFFLLLIPFTLFICFCTAILYYFIDHRERGEKTSMWKGCCEVARALVQINIISLTQFTMLILTGVTFTLFALFFRYFFDALALPWNESVMYWFITILFGMALFIGLFIFTVIMHQTYFIVLLENKNISESFHSAKYVVKTFAFQYLTFYSVLYFFFGFLLYWSFLTYLYWGLFTSIFFILQGSLYLGYTLRKSISSIPSPVAIPQSNPKHAFIIIILFGLINYILVSGVIATQFQYITSSIEKLRSDYYFSEKLATYINPVYSFSVDYPETWTIYERRGSSVTIYNNYTGTLAGGIWMNISVYPYNEQQFDKLYNVRPGLVSLENETNNITTKVTNITIDGYPAINYTYFKQANPYPEYQTHYLIHQDQYVFAIVFTALDKDVAGNNTDLFERIITTFTFIKE